MTLARGALLLFGILAATGARASEGAPLVAAAQPTPAQQDLAPIESNPLGLARTRWCGWQALLVDAAWMGVYTGALKTGTAPGAAIGMAGYLAGVPILRSIHGDGGGWSLMRRVAFPLAGGLLGFGIGSLTERGSHSDDCSEGCATLWLGVIGGSAGMVAAMGYDWVTAREPAPPEPASALAWTPRVVATPRMRGVAFALRF